MSTFRVGLETIDRVWPHPDAERLDLASVKGMSFQFVVMKDKHKAGDRVLYFPIDSLMPEPLIEKLGLEGRLAGKEKNRLKTIKLRKQISQGLVSFPKDLGLSLEEAEALDSKDGLTSHFGVVKFDPPPIPCQNANLIRLPEDVDVYDIEGADRYDSVLQKLLPQRVRIAEKLEGTNWSVTVTADGQIMVNQRNHSIAEHAGKEHFFWKTAREHGWISLAEELHSQLGQITLRGEMLGPGVQKNIYKLEEHCVYLFDILVGTGVNKRYLDGRDYLGITRDRLRGVNQRIAPLIATDVVLKDWLDGRSVQEASNGKSLLRSKTKREGIVITPMVEQQDPNVGRLILKMRSPDYLAKSEF